MFATGSALFGDAQYAIASPRTTNGTDPARSATPSRSHATVEREARVATRAMITTTATEASVKTSADTTRAAMRTTGGVGSVRSHACHGEPRSMAPDTPNWKKPTPSTANAAYDASSRFGLCPARG